MKKFQAPPPPPKVIHPSLLSKVPLTEEEHLSIINPPHAALVLLLEGTATRKNLWDLWFRMRVGLCAGEREGLLSIGQIRAVVLEFENFFLSQPPAKESGFTVSAALLPKIEDVLEITDQLQRMVNRTYQIYDHQWARDYCLMTLNQAERRYMKKLKEETALLRNHRTRVAA